MAKNKPEKLKTILCKELRRNRPVPLFVIVKTKRKVRRNPKRRFWRFSKLKRKRKWHLPEEWVERRKRMRKKKRLVKKKKKGKR